MVAISTLWLPIVLSAVVVFVVSSIIHMALKYHSSDFRKLPSEDELQEAMRKFNIPPGDYMLPHAGSMEVMKSPQYIAKRDKGPVAIMTVFKSGASDMRNSLVLWFVYSLAIGVFCAYIAGRALHPGASYLHVFRFVGATGFFCYTVAGWQNSIWYKKAWGTTIRNTFDGLVYALMTAGVFGWLWPR